MGYFIFALSMWYYASFDLGTDYKHEALARAVQGLRIAPLFISVSQLAYSFLPKEKNNKASSLTNLFRNQGASFGIAFTTTVAARRAQYHRSVLAAQATPLNVRYQAVLTKLSAYFAQHGYGDRCLDPRARAIRPDLGSTGFFPGVPRLLLASGVRLHHRSASGFLHMQVPVGWSRRRTLRTV